MRDRGRGKHTTDSFQTWEQTLLRMTTEWNTCHPILHIKVWQKYSEQFEATFIFQVKGAEQENYTSESLRMDLYNFNCYLKPTEQKSGIRALLFRLASPNYAFLLYQDLVWPLKEFLNSCWDSDPSEPCSTLSQFLATLAQALGSSPTQFLGSLLSVPFFFFLLILFLSSPLLSLLLYSNIFNGSVIFIQ